MITTRPLSTTDFTPERIYFILDALPKFAPVVGVWLNTPQGVEPIDLVDVYFLPDGTLVASWTDAFTTVPLHNAVAQVGDTTQIINFCSIERVLNHYDRPTDSTFGTFSFTNSTYTPKEDDWRCFRGRFGPWHFSEDEVGTVVAGQVIDASSEILVWENILSVNGTGHLIYVEATNKEAVADKKINNSVSPVSGRTLQETLRLIFEWYLVSNAPFDCADDVAVKARDFITKLNLSDSEIQVLEALRPMQIAQFLQGDENARLRPSEIDPISTEITKMVFKRMASCSLSALMRLHGLVYEEEGFTNSSVLSEEQKKLHVAIQRFRDQYDISLDIPIVDRDAVMRKAIEKKPQYEAFISNQLTMLVNRREVLNRVENGNLF